MSRRSANFAASPVLTQDSQGPQKVLSADPRQPINSSCIRPLSGLCEYFDHTPTAIDRMLAFGARHSIAHITEAFPMSKVNDALDHLRAGKARYRIVLVNDQS